MKPLTTTANSNTVPMFSEKVLLYKLNADSRIILEQKIFHEISKNTSQQSPMDVINMQTSQIRITKPLRKTSINILVTGGLTAGQKKKTLISTQMRNCMFD